MSTDANTDAVVHAAQLAGLVKVFQAWIRRVSGGAVVLIRADGNELVPGDATSDELLKSLVLLDQADQRASEVLLHRMRLLIGELAKPERTHQQAPWVAEDGTVAYEARSDQPQILEQMGDFILAEVTEVDPLTAVTTVFDDAGVGSDHG